MSTRFNQLPPKPEYIDAVKAALEHNEEASIRDIARRTRLSQTQSFSALEHLVGLGEVEKRRQNQTPTVLYRLSVRSQ